MSYLVTARKWRPKTFEEVVGQQHITKTLKNAIKNQRIAHAYIFAGPRGVGKTTTARILAKRLNCLSPVDGEPCNECDMCKAFLESQSLDIIEIDGASNRRIEEIRSLRESVKYAPTRGSYKIYIIDEVHMLTTESFNALLKTLEEPPEHTIFIFATTDVHKVPLTIISRCQRFDFRRIEMNEIKSLLKKISEAENIEIDDESLTIIAKKADGALRDAQSLFDQVISFCGDKITINDLNLMLNIITEDIYFEVSDAILEKKFTSAFEITGRLYENGWNYTDFLNGLIEHFRNILTVVLTNGNKHIEATEQTKIKYLNYKDKYSEGDLLRILNFLSKTQYELKSAQNQRLKIEIAVSQLIGLEKTSTISELINNLANVQVSSTVSTQAVSEDKKKTEPVISAVEIDNNNKQQAEISVEEKKDESPAEPEIPAPAEEMDESGQEETEITAIDEPSEIPTEKTFDWNAFTEKFSSENLLRGSHLAETGIIELQGNNIIAGHPNKDDVKILNENAGFYSNAASEYFGSKVKIEFTHSPDLPSKSSDGRKSSAENQNLSGEISELGNEIISQLGGKLLR